MGIWRSLAKKWRCRQTKGVAGLAYAVLMSALATAELPRSWSMFLGSGQLIGLGIAAAGALACFSAAQLKFSIHGGSGVLCEKCLTPALPGTYHCEICKNCTPSYIHHSYWLNICICAENAIAYISTLMGLGIAAGCQVVVGILFIVLMVQGKANSLKFSQQYSPIYLFFLSALLISLLVFLAVCFTFIAHIGKVLTLWYSWEQAKNKASPAYVLPGRVTLHPEGEFSLCATLKAHSDSFESHGGETTGISALKEGEPTPSLQ